jgi:hypothetical protein
MENSQKSNRITPIAVTDYRDIRKLFGIKQKNRRGHMYIIGKTGTGKSTLIENMAISDIKNGYGVALIDPHGDMAGEILDYVPKKRIKDVIYFNPADLDYPIAFNPLEKCRKTFIIWSLRGLSRLSKRYGRNPGGRDWSIFLGTRSFRFLNTRTVRFWTCQSSLLIKISEKAFSTASLIPKSGNSGSRNSTNILSGFGQRPFRQFSTRSASS